MCILLSHWKRTPEIYHKHLNLPKIFILMIIQNLFFKFFHVNYLLYADLANLQLSETYEITNVSLYLVSTGNFSLTLLYIDNRCFHFILLNVASLVTTSESNRVMLMKQLKNHN